jgi:predicted DNA-binding WGR domain protein
MFFLLCLATPVWLTRFRLMNTGSESMSDIHIELRSFDPVHNRRRAWRVVAGPDLFGLWTAHVSFGRIGASGRTMRHEFTTEAAAIGFVRRGLRRRATAVRRLGVPYRPVEASPAADRLLVMTGLR